MTSHFEEHPTHQGDKKVSTGIYDSHFTTNDKPCIYTKTCLHQIIQQRIISWCDKSFFFLSFEWLIERLYQHIITLIHMDSQLNNTKQG